MRKQAQAKDANHDTIAQAYRDQFCSVEDVHQWCRFDLIVGCNGFNDLVEIKRVDVTASRKKLTPNEQDLHDTWRGNIEMIETVSDAVAHVARMRARR